MIFDQEHQNVTKGSRSYPAKHFGGSWAKRVFIEPRNLPGRKSS
jgi:hypothetical protein